MNIKSENIFLQLHTVFGKGTYIQHQTTLC